MRDWDWGVEMSDSYDTQDKWIIGYERIDWKDRTDLSAYMYVIVSTLIIFSVPR